MKEESDLCGWGFLHRTYQLSHLKEILKVCDQGLYITPDFIKDCFLIGYNIFRLIVSKQIVNTNCIK